MVNQIATAFSEIKSWIERGAIPITLLKDPDTDWFSAPFTTERNHRCFHYLDYSPEYGFKTEPVVLELAELENCMTREDCCGTLIDYAFSYNLPLLKQNQLVALLFVDKSRPWCFFGFLTSFTGDFQKPFGDLNLTDYFKNNNSTAAE